MLLPIDDDRLDVRPLVRDEVLYVSADPERTRRPATIERLASAPLGLLRRRVGRQRPDPPPARRARAGARPAPAPAGGGRAQGHRARGWSPPASATPTSPSAYTHAPYYPAGLTTAPFSPAALQHVRDRHPARPRASRPACASCWPSSRRTCTPWRRSSTARGEAQRCSGLGKSKRAPASHSERWLPCAGIPPASLSMRAMCSRFQVANVVLRLVKSFSGPPEPSSR